MSDFPNFDQLLKLANESPDALERFRQEQVELLINEAAPEQRRRLRGLQFQIDAQRHIYRDSPLASCVKLTQMMHESFAQLRVQLNQLTGLTDPIGSPIEALEPLEALAATDNKVSAKVLPFSVS